jgi:4-amino-4-deoxy-L-arabinose transferase-like glycosyltransferase
VSAARAILLLAALLSLWNLWGYDLWAPDEPYFAEGAREMVVDGRWAVPHVNGVVTTDKPPLFFWIIALLSWPFGRVSTLTARLPSALAALGTVALTIGLGRRLEAAPGGGADRSTIGSLAGLVLCTTHLHWDKSRSAQIDALLGLLILSALCAFMEFRSGRDGGRRSGLLFWTAAALAVLAKGPVGLLLPLGIALVTLATDRDLRSWRRFAPFSGPLLFLLIVGAWAAIATIGGGGEYSVWGALKKHALERAIHGMHHAQPPWYYLKVLPVQLLPWSALVPGALLLAWRRRGDPADRFLLVFAGFVVLFFSISIEKRDLYVLPACPAFALLVARLAGTAPQRRWVTVPQALIGLLLAVAGTSLPPLATRLGSGLFKPAIVLGLIMLAGGAAVFGASLSGRPRRAVLVTAAAASAIYLAATSLLLPALDPVNSARSFAREVRSVTASARAAGGSVAAFGIGNLPEAIAFYSDGVYLEEVPSAADLAAHLARGPDSYAVADAARLGEIPAPVRDGLIEVRSADLNRRRVVLIRRYR